MLILYISYIDFKPARYGASLRPQKMYQAFQEEGHTVKLLSGSQERWSLGRRRASVREVSRWLDGNRPDLCYIESPVYPILWGFDRRLIRKIHRLGIPIGYYYRDFYRKFPRQFSRRRSLTGRLKEALLDWLQRRTDRLLKRADIVYVPTREAGELLSYRDIRPLPPGGEDRLEDSRPQGRQCVYIGGMVEHYGGEMLLEAFRRLNRDGVEYPLTVICRKKEWDRIPEELRQGDWLTVRHLSSEEARLLLAQAAAGLLVGRSPHPYNDIAVSVKLFEYMSYGLPMVYVRNAPTQRILDGCGAGVGAAFDPDSFAGAVRELFADPDRYQEYRRCSAQALREGNLWRHRARQVVSDLSGFRH